MSVFADKRFRRLYVSSATSNLADGIGRTALPLLAASFTRNPLLVSGLVTFAFLPWLLFALPGGALVDRIDRRHAMSVANLLRAVSSGTLAVLVFTHTAGIAVLWVVAFALGTAETVYDSASHAILPQVVDADQLERANGLLTVEETLGQLFLGAPAGSALFALAAGLPLVLNATGFVAAAVLVLGLRGSFRPARPAVPSSVRGDMRDGVRWLRGHPFLRSITGISAVSSFAEAMTTGILVLYVLEVLHLPAGDFGLVLLVGGLGAVIGGLTVPALAQRFGRGPVLTTGAFVTALPVIGLSVTHNGYVAAALLGVSSFGVMTWNVLMMSLRQALVPHELFGRVQGAYRTVVWGAIPAGSLVGGLLAHLIGLSAVFAVSGGLLLLGAIGLARLVRVHRQVVAAEAVPAGSVQQV